MSTLTFSPIPDAPISTDEFRALEEKVMLAVQTIRSERDARLVAEAEANGLRAQLQAHMSRTMANDLELSRLREERDGIRQRVEKMLRQLDELN